MCLKQKQKQSNSKIDLRRGSQYLWCKDNKRSGEGERGKAQMLPLSQTPAGVLPARRLSLSTIPSLKFSNPNPFRRSKFIPRRNPTKPFNITLSKAEGTVDSTKQALSNSPTPPPFPNDQTVFVGDENVPLEGVIQFDKPNTSSRLTKWG